MGSDEFANIFLEAYEFPLSEVDQTTITEMLREHEVFAPSFALETNEDLYDPLFFRRQANHHDTSITILADRNVVTRWIAVLSGKVASSQERLAAAIMTFAQSANILVEPNLALYEGASSLGSDAAHNELAQFRIADNLATQLWTDLAIGRIQGLAISQLDLSTVPHDCGKIDFGICLRRWVRNYIILLKIAELELREPDRTKQLTELVRWMYRDFIIGGPSLIFAIYYLTPNSARRGLLKNLRSSDREKALRGIRNASWDITFLSEWIRRGQEQKDNNTLTLLCSLDRKLMQLARMLVLPPAGDFTEVWRLSLMNILNPWGERDARKISKFIENHRARMDNPSRQIARPQDVEIDQMIEAGEKLVRNWKST